MPINFNQDVEGKWIAPEITDANGNPTTIQNPVYTSSNLDLVTVDFVNESAAAHIVHGRRDKTGVCQLTLSGDADLGEGIVPISYTEDITVGPGNASSIRFVEVEG